MLGYDVPIQSSAPADKKTIHKDVFFICKEVFRKIGHIQQEEDHEQTNRKKERKPFIFKGQSFFPEAIVFLPFHLIVHEN